ncbi:MAG: hypothetical protein PVG49_20520 [Desulfobacteraceae bacterium]|jgi:hypothetical protein
MIHMPAESVFWVQDSYDGLVRCETPNRDFMRDLLIVLHLFLGCKPDQEQAYSEPVLTIR